MTESELNICKRFKEIRKELGMKQNDFAQEIKLTQGHVSDIENLRKGVSERIVEIICLKFGINEEWFRTGKGDMKNAISGEERYSINIAKLQRTDNETIIRWVNAIAEAKPEMLKEIESFMKKILNIEE